MNFNNEIFEFDGVDTSCNVVNVSTKDFVETGSKLLNLTVSTCSVRSEPINDEIIFEGSVKFVAVVKTGEEIRKTEKTERFSTSVKSYGVSSDSRVFSTCYAEKVKGYIEAGSLMMSCCLNIQSIIIKPTSIELLCDNECDDVFVKKELITYNKLVYSENIRFNASETTQLSTRFPEILEILSSTASVNLNEVHISAGQLVLGGEVVVQTLYKSTDDYEPIVQLTDKIGFTHISDVNAEDTNSAYVELSCEEINVMPEMNEHGEKRLLSYNLGIFGYFFAMEKREQEIVTDAFFLSKKTDCEFEKLESSSLGEIKSYSVMKNVVLDLPEGKNPVSRINGAIFNLGSIKYLEDNGRSYISCIGEVALTYVASGTGETEGFNTSVAFEILCDECYGECFVPGLSISDIQVSLLSGKQIEIRLSLKISSKSLEKNNINVVTDIIDSDEEYCEFGIVVYNAQKGESLWNICKNYGVSPEEIKKLNPEIKDENNINQKIYIFRKLTV